MKKSGKVIACVLVLGAAAVLIAFALAFKDTAIELWAVRRFEQAQTQEEKVAAIERLGELRSKRAVAALVELTYQTGPEADAAAKVLTEQIGPPAAPNLIRVILRPDAEPYARQNAAVILARIGIQSAEVVPLIIRAYNGEAGRDLLYPLIEILDGNTSIEAEMVLRAVRQRKPAERCELIGAMAFIRSRHELQIGILVAELEAVEESVRLAAAEALSAIGPEGGGAVPALARALEDPEDEVRRAAAIALGMIGPAAAGAAAPLEKALQDPEDAVVACAVGSLARIAPGRLIKIAAAPGDEDLRLQVLDVLGMTGAEEAVETMIRIARGDQSERVRIGAIEALGEMRDAGKPAIPTLIEVLEKEDGNRLRYAAAAALGDIRARPEAVVPALASALESEDRLLRSGAFYALSRFGADGSAALPALIKALGDPRAADEAAAVLSKMGAGAAEGLAGALAHENPRTRWAAAAALGELGTDAAGAVSALARTLDDPDEQVRYQAAASLGRLGALAEEAAPALAKRLEDPVRRIRLAAAFALAQSGAETAGKAAPVLAEGLGADGLDTAGRLEILDALAALGAGGVAILSGSLADGDEAIRRAAALRLGALAGKARGAIPALEKLTGDPSPAVRDAAAGALESIRGGE